MGATSVSAAASIQTLPGAWATITVCSLLAKLPRGGFRHKIIRAAEQTYNQSAAIQAVQMGSFLLSLLLSGYLFAVKNIPPQIRAFIRRYFALASKEVQ